MEHNKKGNAVKTIACKVHSECGPGEKDHEIISTCTHSLRILIHTHSPFLHVSSPYGTYVQVNNKKHNKNILAI